LNTIAIFRESLPLAVTCVETVSAFSIHIRRDSVSANRHFLKLKLEDTNGGGTSPRHTRNTFVGQS
jgi:hypothetical protein